MLTKNNSHPAIDLINKILSDLYSGVFAHAYNFSFFLSKEKSSSAVFNMKLRAEQACARLEELYHKEKIVLFPYLLNQITFDSSKKTSLNKPIEVSIETTKEISKYIQEFSMQELPAEVETEWQNKFKMFSEDLKTSWIRLVKNKELLFAELGLAFPNGFSLW